MASPRKGRNGNERERTTRARPRSSAGGGLLAAAFKGALVAVCVGVIFFAHRYYKGVEARNAQIEEENRKIREQNARGGYEYEVQQGPQYEKKMDGSLGERAREAKAPEAPAGSLRAAAAPSDEFEQFKKKGNDLFFDAEFTQAADAFARAVEYPAPEGSISSIRDASDACRMFADITEGVKPSVEAIASDLYMIKLKSSGSEFRAKVLSQDATTVWYLKDKIRGQLPRENIESMTPVKQEDRNREMAEKLEDIKAKAAMENDSLAYYLAALDALRFNFRKEAANLLKKAYDLDKERGAVLRDTVLEYQAMRLFKVGAWYYSVGVPQRGEKKFNELIAQYPDTRAAKEARETMAELQRQQELVYINQQRIKEMQEQEARRRREEAARAQDDAAKGGGEKPRRAAPKTVEDEGRDLLDLAQQGGGDVRGKDEEAIRKANEAYSRGVDEYNKGMSVSSARESNEHYKNATKYLREAVDLYSQALEKDKGNQQLADRAQDAQAKLYWSKKSTRVM